MKNKFVFIAAVLVFFICFIPLSFARLQMEVMPGFDGNLALGSGFSSIAVKITAEAEPFDGYIEFVTARPYRGTKTKIIRKPAAVPAHTAKKFILYAIPQESFSVRLYDNQNKLYLEAATDWHVALTDNYKKITYQSIPYKSFFLLTVDNKKNRINFQHSEEYKFTNTEAVIKPDELPGHIAAYDLIDIIILRNITKEEVKEYFNKSAVIDWVRLGGTMLITAADNYDVLNDIDWALRVEANDPVKINFSNFSKQFPSAADKKGRVSAASLKFPQKQKPDFIIKDNAGGIIYAEIKYGMGQICLLTPDIKNIEIKNYIQNSQDFFDRLINKSEFPAFYMGYESWFSGLSENLKKYRPYVRPNPYYILIFIIIFILAIIPVNYLILKKNKKIVYFWVTAPLISVLFSVFSYGWMRTYSLNEFYSYNFKINAMNSGDNYKSAAEFSYIISPEKTNYEISAGVNKALYYLPSRSNLRAHTLKYRQDKNKLKIEDFFLAAKTSRNFLVKGVEKNQGSVFASYEHTEGTNLHLSVVNNMPVNIQKAFVVWGDGFYEIGDIAEFDEKNLKNVSRKSVPELNEFLLGADITKNFPRLDKNKKMELYIKSVFLNFVLGDQILNLEIHKQPARRIYGVMMYGLFNARLELAPVLIFFTDYDESERSVTVTGSKVNEESVSWNIFAVFMD